MTLSKTAIKIQEDSKGNYVVSFLGKDYFNVPPEFQSWINEQYPTMGGLIHESLYETNQLELLKAAMVH